MSEELVGERVRLRPGRPEDLDDNGHHRLTIDPAAANGRAIAAYAKAGFRPVGVLRQHERAADGTWRDSLLMDLVKGELR